MNDPTRALRGAVDLSGLGGPARPSTPAGAPAPTQTGAAGPAAPAAPGAPGETPGGAPAPAAGGSLDALLVEATDATFNQVVSRSGVVPSVAVVWSSEHPESQALLRDAFDIATGLEGRLQVVSIDIATNPQIAQAIQPPEVPLALGLVGGQPVPLFSGLVDREQFRQVLDQLLQVAVQHGITGRVSADQAPEGAEEELPPLHQEAYDAIERGDLDAAAAAYDKAIAADPKDTDAQLGLAQVGLMKRTQESTSRPPGRLRRTTRATSTPRSSSPTSTSSAVTSRTPSPGSSTSSGSPRARSATGSRPTCSISSPSSATTTSACARAARR